MSGPWFWIGVMFAAVFVSLVTFPAIIVGRRDDEAHGRLEEQQAER